MKNHLILVQAAESMSYRLSARFRTACAVFVPVLKKPNTTTEPPDGAVELQLHVVMLFINSE